MGRILERDLVDLSVEIIADFGDPDLGLSVTELAPRLRERISPSTEDLEILRSRLDDRLSQVIRNLVSHRTLERRGLAVYVAPSSRAVRSGRYVLTAEGRKDVIPEKQFRLL